MNAWPAIILVSALSLEAADQPRFGAALKFGARYTGWFQEVFGRESARDHSNSWTLGPAVEIRLTGRFGIEAGALYRRIGRDAGGGYSFYPFSDRERGYSWEFPVLGRYSLPVRLKGLHPFAAAGLSFEWQRTHTDSYGTSFTTNPDGAPVFFPVSFRSAASDANAGFTGGFGLEPRAGRLRLIVESRYTVWFDDANCTQIQPALRCVERHQGVFLLGVGF